MPMRTRWTYINNQVLNRRALKQGVLPVLTTSGAPQPRPTAPAQRSCGRCGYLFVLIYGSGPLYRFASLVGVPTPKGGAAARRWTTTGGAGSC